MLMLRDPPRRDQAAEQLKSAQIADPINRELFDALIAERESEGAIQHREGLSSLAEARLGEIESDPEEISDADRSFKDAAADIKLPWLFRRRDALKAQQAGANDEEELGIVRELDSLSREIRELDTSLKASPRYRWDASGASRRPDTTPTEDD
jgi:hypothetical protein